MALETGGDSVIMLLIDNSSGAHTINELVWAEYNRVCATAALRALAAARRASPDTSEGIALLGHTRRPRTLSALCALRRTVVARGFACS